MQHLLPLRIKQTLFAAIGMLSLSLCMAGTKPTTSNETKHPSKPLLLFEIDEGFSDSLLGVYQNDPEGLRRNLINIRNGLAPLTLKYDVAVLVYPCQAYRNSAKSDGVLGHVRPSLLHLLDFFKPVSGKPRIGVFLEAYSSGIQTEQDGSLDRRPTPILGLGPNDQARPGLSMDIPAFEALANAYPDVLRGIRFHEVYGSDIVWKVRPVGDKGGFVLDEQLIRGCVSLCKRKHLRLIWSDSTWLERCVPMEGPNFVYSPSHPPYCLSEPYRSLQDEAEQQLGRLLCFSWANNNYHFTPNLEFLSAKIGPSKPGLARPIPPWLYFDMPFAEFPLKHRKTAVWGMSIQSWFWHEMTNTLTGHYYQAGELACPVEILNAYVQKGLQEGASVLQFEPSWYFFNEPMHGRPEYAGVYEHKPDHSARLALKRLEQTLLDPPSRPLPLDAIFDRNQQRFHENDFTDPPRNYAQSTLVLNAAWYDFYSYGPRWKRQDANRMLPSVLKGVKDACRIELQGDGVDEILTVRQGSADTWKIGFYSQNGGFLGSELSVPNEDQDGVFAGLATANLIPEVVGQGDPDEIVVARRPHGSGYVNLRVFKMSWVSGDGLSFRYLPLDDRQNREAIDRSVGRSLDASSFVGMAGLRSDARLYSDGKRSTDRLAILAQSAHRLTVTTRIDGKDSSTSLAGVPEGAAWCAIDERLGGADSLCFVWKGHAAIYRATGSGLAPPEGLELASDVPASRAFALRKRILLDGRRP